MYIPWHIGQIVYFITEGGHICTELKKGKIVEIVVNERATYYKLDINGKIENSIHIFPNVRKGKEKVREILQNMFDMQFDNS